MQSHEQKMAMREAARSAVSKWLLGGLDPNSEHFLWRAKCVEILLAAAFEQGVRAGQKSVLEPQMPENHYEERVTFLTARLSEIKGIS